MIVDSFTLLSHSKGKFICGPFDSIPVEELEKRVKKKPWTLPYHKFYSKQTKILLKSNKIGRNGTSLLNWSGSIAFVDFDRDHKIGQQT